MQEKKKWLPPGWVLCTEDGGESERGGKVHDVYHYRHCHRQGYDNDDGKGKGQDHPIPVPIIVGGKEEEAEVEDHPSLLRRKGDAPCRDWGLGG